MRSIMFRWLLVFALPALVRAQTVELNDIAADRADAREKTKSDIAARELKLLSEQGKLKALTERKIAEQKLADQNLVQGWHQLLQNNATAAPAALRIPLDISTYTALNRTEKGAFLGIAVSPVPAVLREQLGLPSGVGLVVEHVDAKSPAEGAGVKQYDVLHKLGDQLLVNSSQFAVLVRTYKPGDEIRLALIRHTQPMVVTVRPVERDLPILSGDQVTLTPLAIHRYGALDADAKNWEGAMTRVYTPAGETAVLSDKNLVVKMTTEKGNRTLIVLDSASGKILYQGPIDTEEQRKSLPKDIALKLRELEGTRIEEPVRAKPLPPGAVAPPKPARRTPAPQQPVAPTAKPQEPRSISYTEGGYTLQVTVKAGTGDTLKVTNASGDVIYSGPLDNAAANEAIPQRLRDRLSSPAWQSMIKELDSPATVGR